MTDTPRGISLEIGSILSHRTKEGMVEMTVNGEKMQMDLPKAREVLAMLHGAIEAAVTDQIVFKFMKEIVGLDDQRAAAVLVDLRELRQGSRGTVYPQ